MEQGLEAFDIQSVGHTGHMLEVKGGGGADQRKWREVTTDERSGETSG